MKKFSKPRINTFFIEIIVVILFFSLASTIIVHVFAQTNYDICLNKVKSKAIINSRCLSDMYSTNQDISQTLVRVFGDKCNIYTDNNGQYIVELDYELKQTDNTNVVLIVAEEKTETESGIYGEIKLEYEYLDKVVYETSAASYIVK